ncbi:MAG: hypothetical protein ACE5FS_03925 [Paracoccaceae bacterium]
MRIRILGLAVVAAALPATAFAYIGPGAGLSAIGTLLAVAGAVLLAIVGFIWYPVKRLLKGRRRDPADAAGKGAASDET